jgi:His/Glu/Gln/Arg/opine family amino acid ABC transporter permease subunit
VGNYWEIVRQYGPLILGGLKFTLIITVASLLGSIVLGLGLALVRRSRRRWVSWPAVWYIEIIRGTPVLLVLLVVYFGLSGFGILIPPVQSAIIAFSVNGAAFMAEIFRSGIQSIDTGQSEAATALGMSAGTTMRRIILPQAVYVILPPVANFGVETLKASSLALVIAVPEITYRAYNAIGQTFATFQILSIAAAIYVGLSVPLSRAIHRMELRLAAKR